jgi:T5SS/PEP-CTERM-associated repeat protein
MRPSGFAGVVRGRLSSSALALLFTALAAPSLLAAISANGDNTNATTAGGDPVIGVSDFGRLTINGGSNLAQDLAVLGDLATGIGLVTVTDFNTTTGNPSTWTTNVLVVGDGGWGNLDIQSGAIVSVDFALPTVAGTGDLIIGNLAESIGEVTVSGLGSMLRLGDDATIGGAGTGTLRIADDGYVLATNSSVLGVDQFTVGALGRVELDGGRLRTFNLTNNGMIIGGGRIDNGAAIANSTTGHIEAHAGDRLVINAPVDNKGAVAIRGGEIEFLKTITNSNAAAEFTLRDNATARFLPSNFGFDSTAGVLASTSGVNDVYGTVRIQGVGSKISVAGQSTLVFHEPVTNAGGTISVEAGSSIVYLQGLTAAGGSTFFSVGLSSGSAGGLFNPLAVSGAVNLEGALGVNLDPGYSPTAGENFVVLSASGGIFGSLSLASAPPLPGGMQWNLEFTPTTVVLSVVATGDYNGNGVVDAADYIVWRNSQAQEGPGLAADADGDQIVDVDDYNFWRSRLGSVVSSGFGGSVSIPEPSAIALLVMAAAYLRVRRR